MGQPYRRYKREEYEKAMKLHKAGWSYLQISKELDIHKVTIYSWSKGHKPHSAWTKEEKEKWNDKKFTEQARVNMSASQKRRAPFSLETREKIRATKIGPLNPMWKGEEAKEKAIRKRLRRSIPVPKGSDRHHIDGNGQNSDPSNILVLTRRKHMIEDGRMFRRDKYGRFKSTR